MVSAWTGQTAAHAGRMLGATILLLASATVLPLRSLSSRAPGAPPQVVLTLIRPPAHDPGIEMPAVFGDTVIWGGENDAWVQGSIYTASLRLRQPHLVAHTAPGTHQLNMMLISAHWLSWVEYDANAQWRLVAQNRQSGQRIVVDSNVQEGGFPLGAPLLTLSALDGETLIWSFSVIPRQGTPWTGIRVQVLPHGPRRLLARETVPCYVTWPAVSGSIAAWDREGSCVGHNSDVIVANWRTGHSYALTHDHRSSEPTINGDLVAYKGDGLRLGSGTIVLVNLRTGHRRIVDATRQAAVPQLTDRVLAWYSTYGIAGLDLRTNRRYVLARDSTSATPNGFSFVYNLLGQSWQNEVVFMEVFFRMSGGPESQRIVVAHVP